ncbi:hypothetical protein FPOAC2_11309 [Fusarium poae]
MIWLSCSVHVPASAGTHGRPAEASDIFGSTPKADRHRARLDPWRLHVFGTSSLNFVPLILSCQYKRLKPPDASPVQLVPTAKANVQTRFCPSHTPHQPNEKRPLPH